MDKVSYKIEVRWHDGFGNDEDLFFEEKYDVDNFFINIKDKHKNYNVSYSVYSITEKLLYVNHHKDLLCYCE